MHIHKLGLLTFALVGLLFVSGCARDGKTRPSCPAPDGIRCLSAIDVYERTNTSDTVSAEPVVQANLVSSGVTPITGNSTWGTRVDGDTLALDAAPPLPGRGVPRSGFVTPTSASEPFRVPAKVMRIFVQAWEDEQGDLHTPGFIFTEIEPRRWTVGQPALESDNTFRLLEGLGPRAAQDAQADAAATAKAGHPARIGKPTTSRN